MFTNYYAMVMFLQIFADAGTNINATGGTVNAYTGATSAYPETGGMDPTLKEFYDTELLENTRVELYYAQFAKKQPLPSGNGRSIEWRKWNTFKPAKALQEGVIPTGQTFGMTRKNDSIDQFGTYAAVTDVLELHAYDDVILGATEEMGASAAETQETLIRDDLLTGTNVMYCDNITLATGAVTGTTPDEPAKMEASTTVCALLTPAMVAKAVTKMKKDRVPTINGKYYCVLHPSVAHDLRQSKDWIEAHKYDASAEIFNGEIGELHGMRFIENTFAPILGGEYKNKANTVTYACYCFGKDAFGIIDPDGGALKMIVKNKGQIGGPLEQFSTIGYKLETNGSKILYEERVLRLMCCSSYSAIDESNYNPDMFTPEQAESVGP